MQGNTISSNVLNESGKNWIERSFRVLKVQEYGKGSVRNYIQELTLLFKFYNDMQVEELRQEHIEQYLLFIKEHHKVGRAKCRSVAQACSFFFKKVMPVTYVVPSNLYPKKITTAAGHLSIPSRDAPSIPLHTPTLHRPS